MITDADNRGEESGGQPDDAASEAGMELRCGKDSIPKTVVE